MKQHHDPPAQAARIITRLLLLPTMTALLCLTVTTAYGKDHKGPPPAPSLTLAIETNGLLRFSWKPVPEAQYYRLLMDRNGKQEFKVVTDQLHTTATTFRPPARGLFDETEPLYRVEACNGAGCTPSNVTSQGMVELLELPANPEFEKSLDDLLNSNKPAQQ